jgi:uncharacterized SAM-binding protein YcdF (DUF218 family)
VKPRRRIVVLAVVLAAAVWFGRDRILTAMGAYLVNASPPEKADIAVVLAGDIRGHRILTAGELVKNGYAPVALISGPNRIYGQHECDLEIAFAVKKGYPQAYFAPFPDDVWNTGEEVAAIMVELRRRHVHKVLLVTSNYHTRRAVKMFRKAAAGEITAVAVAAPDDFFTPDGWWKNREGQKTFLSEWEKTIAVWVGL